MSLTKLIILVSALIVISLSLWWVYEKEILLDSSNLFSKDNKEQISENDTEVKDELPNATSTDPDPIKPIPKPVLSVVAKDANLLQVEVVATIDLDEQGSAPCGPIAFGDITWGDGKAETVYGLGCSSNEQTLEVSHQYETAGEYTVTFTDLQGVEVGQTVSIGAD